MALGLTKVKSPQEIAELWAMENVIPAHQRAGEGKVECLASEVGKLTVDTVKFLVSVIFGTFGPVFWKAQAKAPHKGKIAILAPNRETVTVGRDGLPLFFGVTTSDALGIKASGQSIQRFLQAFGAAYLYYQGDKDKVENALVNALDIARSPTPAALLGAAKGKVIEGMEHETVDLAWGEILKPKPVSIEDHATKLVHDILSVMNKVGVTGADPVYASITYSDLERVGVTLKAAKKRLGKPVVDALAEMPDEVSEGELDAMIEEEAEVTV